MNFFVAELKFMIGSSNLNRLLGQIDLALDESVLVVDKDSLESILLSQESIPHDSSQLSLLSLKTESDQRALESGFLLLTADGQDIENGRKVTFSDLVQERTISSRKSGSAGDSISNVSLSLDMTTIDDSAMDVSLPENSTSVKHHSIHESEISLNDWMNVKYQSDPDVSISLSFNDPVDSLQGDECPSGLYEKNLQALRELSICIL